LHNEELPDLYSSPDIKRRVRLARHGAHMRGRKQMLTGLRWENLKEETN